MHTRTTYIQLLCFHLDLNTVKYIKFAVLSRTITRTGFLAHTHAKQHTCEKGFSHRWRCVKMLTPSSQPPLNFQCRFWPLCQNSVWTNILMYTSKFCRRSVTNVKTPTRIQRDTTPLYKALASSVPVQCFTHRLPRTGTPPWGSERSKKRSTNLSFMFCVTCSSPMHGKYSSRPIWSQFNCSPLFRSMVRTATGTNDLQRAGQNLAQKNIRYLIEKRVSKAVFTFGDGVSFFCCWRQLFWQCQRMVWNFFWQTSIGCQVKFWRWRLTLMS